MPTGLSIHIGLNKIDETHYGTTGDLANPENDAASMAELATANGFTASPPLLTNDATSTAVTNAIKQAASTLTSGDILLLTYAGHGAQIPDANGDEKDAQDETWVLYDRQLLDDELYGLLATLADGVRVLILSDSCHSGTVARDLPLSLTTTELERAFDTNEPHRVPQRIRTLPHEAQLHNYQRDQQLYTQIQRATPAQPAFAADVLLISGCQDNQTSSDGTSNHGLFTQTLLNTWNNGAFKGTYATLHKKIVADMPFFQTPNLFQAGKTSAAFRNQAPFTI